MKNQSANYQELEFIADKKFDELSGSSLDQS